MTGVVTTMKSIDLTPFKNELTDEELQDLELGQIVSVDDYGPGIIAAFAEESFEYPVGSAERVERIEDEDEEIGEDDMQEIEASEDSPVYIVALQDGGSVAVSEDEISTDASLEGDDGAEITSWDEIGGSAEDAELSAVYQYCEEPHSRESLEAAKVKMIHERQAAALADYVENEEMNVSELQEYSYEELVNIPGVDDPHVGFDELPPGWTRKSVLQAWATLGGMWRTCFPRMTRHFGPNMARRWCAALKDEVLRTEEWRGKF